MSDFNTREAWLDYRSRKPKQLTWVFVSVKPHPKIEGAFIGVTYSGGRTKEKNKKWRLKIEARNARRAAKLVNRKGPVETVSVR